ncbi:hypothetical protein M9Y10_035342 [Tritrichomonas musculus]|uniref:Protein kinase domain-containing protein n=1 Tax=Tritrichomonas musculus TaxID=1915356 RepID=A0ABR2KHE5_9EUKA
MSDYPIPVIQWIQNLKHNLHFLLLSCGQNSAYIHACKFAEIGNYLLKFLEALDKYSSVRDATPEESENYRSLLKLIEDMTAYVKSYHRENYLKTILSNRINDISNEIKNFREKFNKLCLSLNMLDSNKKPYYPNNQIQFNYNDIEDSKNLINILKSAIEGPKKSITNEDEIQTIRHKILELETTISEKNALFLNSYQNQILSKEEVSKELENFKEWEVSVPDDFYIKNKTVVGHGGFSTVYLGGQLSTNKIVAIKQYLRTEFTAKDLEMYKREISTYLFLQTPTKHPCLLTFVGATMKPPYCILTEYMSGQSLYVRLHNRGLKYEPLSPTAKTIITIGIAHGMEYLHSKGLIHRDLKSLNVLLDNDDYPRICDFGLSRSQGTDSEVMTKGVGTFRWMAPEVFQSNHYNSKVDVYSFGILLWEMLTEKIPFIDDGDCIREISQIDKRPKIPEDCPANVSAFITDCWDKDPEHRPDFKSISTILDEGEIEFPGTDRSKVEEYIKTIIVPSDPKRSIELLINELEINSTQTTRQESTGSTPSYEKLIEVVKKMDFKDLSSSFSSILENYEDPRKTTCFISICLEYRDDFLDILKNSFSEFLTFYAKNIDSGLISVTFKILTKDTDHLFHLGFNELLATIQYMNSNNIEMSTLNFLHQVITNNQFNSMDDVVQTVPSLLVSLQIAKEDEIFLSILSLFEKIMHFNGFVSIIVENKSQIFFAISLLRTTLIPLKLLNFIFANSMPNRQCIEFIFPYIKELLLQDDESIIVSILEMAKYLLKSDYTFQLFSKLAQNPFSVCFTDKMSDHVKIMALKTSFILFNNLTTFSMMFQIVDEVIQLLLSENEEVQILAALCLTQLPSNCVSKLCCETVSQFFQKTFIKLTNSVYNENKLKLILFSLRLCGIMTETKEGTIFVIKFTDSIVPFLYLNENDLNSNNCEDIEKVKKFTCILLTSISSYNQYIDAFEKCIDGMFEIAETTDYYKYSLGFLANISSNVDFAIKESTYMEKLIDMMDSGIHEAFPIIWRIATAPESFDYLSNNFISTSDNSNCKITLMQKMVKCLLSFSECELHELIIDIFQSISICKEGKKALKNEGVDEYLNERLNEASDEDSLRLIYVKILSRLKNV